MDSQPGTKVSATKETSTGSNATKVIGSPTRSIASIRKIILLYSMIVVLLIGFPWFVYTTTIHRAALPTEEISQFEEQLNHVAVKTPVYIDASFEDAQYVPSLEQSFHKSLYQRYPNLQNKWSVEFSSATNDMVNKQEDLVIKIDVDSAAKESEQISISPFEKSVHISFKDNLNNDFVVNALLNEVFLGEITKFDRLVSNNFNKLHESVVIPYSPHYNLIFSLMVEDGNVVDWDSDTIHKVVQPLLNSLKHFANFTIFTQVQYYSKLQVSKTFNETTNTFVVKESDLSNFINFSDWNLNNHDINPSINFIIYYPSSNSDNTPTVIENSKTNSFLIPQYGGLHILRKKIDVLNDNDEIYIVDVELIEVLEIFSSQLFKLLGIESTKPKNPLLRIDSLTKYSILSNLHQGLKTLKSLIKLTNDLHEISVPELTKSYVHKSLASLGSAVQELEHFNFKYAMIASSVGLKNSFSAFFDKDIVQQAYFPSEHKLAVFLPLIGPLCSILIFSTIRQIKEWKQGRKQKS